MTQHTVTSTATADPALCFTEIGRIVADYDKGWKAVAKRSFSSEFINTIQWKSITSTRLEGNLGRQWGKAYRGMPVTFTRDGMQFTTTLREWDWMIKARWPIYVVCAVIPPLWWMLFINAIWHLGYKIGMPGMTKKVSAAMLGYMGSVGK